LQAKARRLRIVEEQMTFDELLALRRREMRRRDESPPFSPEWDAAMAAVEDLDEQLRARAGELTTQRSSTTHSRVFRDGH
jgi:hypothetical protein